MIRLATLTATAAAVITLGTPAATASPAAHCERYYAADVTSGGLAYRIEADAFGGQPQCITHGSRPAFTLTSGGITRHGPVQAYPHILTAAPGFPVRISAMGTPSLTWYARPGPPAGRWNMAAESWITAGQSPASRIRAELMIWLDTSAHLYATAPRNVIVRVDGARWYVQHWGKPGPGTWAYLHFERVAHVTRVRNLALRPFYRAAIRLHLVKRWWHAQSWEAGFEIWSMPAGARLATTWLRIRP